MQKSRDNKRYNSRGTTGMGKSRGTTRDAKVEGQQEMQKSRDNKRYNSRGTTGMGKRRGTTRDTIVEGQQGWAKVEGQQEIQ